MSAHTPYVFFTAFLIGWVIVAAAEIVGQRKADLMTLTASSYSIQEW
jgi:hypothetical protein